MFCYFGEVQVGNVERLQGATNRPWHFHASQTVPSVLAVNSVAEYIPLLSLEQNILIFIKSN